MGIAHVCFVKTPGLTPAKTRLAADIGTQKAEELYKLLLQRCMKISHNMNHSYFALNEAQARHHSLWSREKVYIQKGNTLAEKLRNAEDYFLKYFQAVIFWGADCPSLRLQDFINLRESLKKHHHAIIPAQDGGFVAYAAKVPLAEKWLNVKMSSHTTLHDLRNQLKGPFKLLDQRSDLDEIQDIAQVLKDMNLHPSKDPKWQEIKDLLSIL